MRVTLQAFVASCVVACATDAPPSTDAGPDPSISACCTCLVDPTCTVQGCLDERVCEIGDGERHWLSCLGGYFGLAYSSVCR